MRWMDRTVVQRSRFFGSGDRVRVRAARASGVAWLMDWWLVVVLIVWGVVLLMGAVSASAQGAGEGGDAGPSIDDLLGIPGTDDGGEKKPGAGDASGVGEEGKPIGLSDDLERRLDGAAAADVFDKAREGMGDVAVRLKERLDGGKDTLREQQLILDRLDQVIRSAKKMQSASGEGEGEPSDGESGKPKPKPQDKPGEKPGDQGKPGEKPGEGEGQEGEEPGVAEGGQPQGGGQSGSTGGPSVGAVGPDGSGVSMKDLRDGEWGNLPPRLRHELTESIGERFSPVYRRQTEAFYRRIAEALRDQPDS